MNDDPMVLRAKRSNPGERHYGFVPLPSGTQKASQRTACAARGLQTKDPQKTMLKKSSSIMEVLFKNVFLKGAINSVKRQQEGGAVPTDLGPGAPTQLWKVVIQGAECEAEVGVPFYLILVKWVG